MDIQSTTRKVETRDQFGFPLTLSYCLEEKEGLYYLSCRKAGCESAEAACGPFSDRREGLAFLEKMAAYTVTPETLFDIFQDSQ